MADLSRQVEKDAFCAQLSREANDPLLGTATAAKVWFLLEYRGPWEAKATNDNDLPAQVQGYLSEQLTAVPDSRLLFIKQQNPAREALRFFVARTDEVAPALYEFELDSYEALLDLDVTAVAAGDNAVAENNAVANSRREEPLFLVCTNGKRDRCCARYGVPLYRALLDDRGTDAWQSTHIGGHRYAPTVLFLPHSVNYGLLAPEEIAQAVDAHIGGEIYDLDRYRGRTYYAAHVQAADTFLRRELDLHALSGIRLRTAERVEEEKWRVQFDLAASGETHEILLLSQKTERPRLASCSSPAVKPLSRYRLLEHTVVGAE